MRARTNATSRRVEAAINDGVAKSGAEAEEADCNGKDKPKPKFKRPMAKFKLPPPPKMSALSTNRNGGTNRDSAAQPKVNGNPSDHVVPKPPSSGHLDNSEHLNGNESVSSPNTSAPPQPPPAPTILIPPPPSSTSSAVYQRPNRKPQPSVTANASKSSAVPSESTGIVDAPKSSISDNSYSSSNPIPVQQYSLPSAYPQISPYKPSSWYANARGTRDSQRRRQLFGNALRIVMAIATSVFLWHGYQQMKSHENAGSKRHYKNYHHHDKHHHHFHPMLGIDESPMGFANEKATWKRSYRELEQEHSSSTNDESPKGAQSSPESQIKQTYDVHPLFSTFPVATLSNKRLLPYVGFGVSSRSIDHKQIPIIISTLLQYASSETEGGGGIAMIDAVIDEDRKLENHGGSLQYSISNTVVERYEAEEEKLESSMAKNVVSLVGRAINFFGKERNKSHGSKSSSVGQTPGSKDSDGAYDYENRLEVHLLVGLSGPDLGVENTIAALKYFVAELDGIIPPFPKDATNTDFENWKPPPSSPTAVDHHVDVRLHVLLRLNHCHNKSHHVAPCSADEATNSELLGKFIASYTLLERLYEANLIHGIGLDAIHGEDLWYLLSKCKIQPQLYRGDVSQALDVYDRRHGREQVKENHIATILKAHNVQFVASNVAGHILERKPMAPNAYALLQNLGGVLFRAHLAAEEGNTSIVTAGHKGEGQYYTVPRVVLSYLVHHKVCVLPHAYKAEHLADDAPESVGGLANFLTERRVAEIGYALRALLSESDLPEDHGLGMEGENEVALVFHNMMTDDAHLFRVSTQEEVDKGNAEKEVALPPDRGGLVKSGKSVVIISNTGDKFVAYSGNDGQLKGSYTVTIEAGGATDFTIPTNNVQ